MTLELPSPIAAYVAANARLDVEGMLSPFTPDAVIFADGGRHEGHAGMRALFEAAVIPVRAIFTPDAVRQENFQENGQVVVEGPAHGDFEGSPIRFTYRFTLDNDAIKALEITA
ncbi:nuclear transport factor 2 family protein [Bradyrhizobium sp. HKCCYLR20261]|uniref:nuclear transport factor 2 family protein n=1 Tax=Bradyrhizobium sp. HKCCYLR20261 TaxID=3420760 RepID=UPI003EC02EDC